LLLLLVVVVVAPKGSSSNIRESKSTFAIFLPYTAFPPEAAIEVLNTTFTGAFTTGATSEFSRLHWNLA
jgi:hypothetical protein